MHQDLARGSPCDQQSESTTYQLEFVLPDQKNIGGEQCIRRRETGRIESNSHVLKMQRHSSSGLTLFCATILVIDQ